MSKNTSCGQNRAPCGGQKAPATSRTICLTVGTAGHIDHGKTSLTKILTGCDCDTLPEEKERGMTIDLGFATCVLPNDRRVGIVDVPGHERFVHNMVAGATGIDVVMLVIAADDGVMPQTIEHFHIVRLLGIKSGMIALTKIDLATKERIADVTAHIRNLVAGSFLEDAPILPISTKTGEGFDGFYDTFVKIVNKAVEHESSGPFRMHIERSFVIKGLGTVISGIPRSGKVKNGDIIELLPEGRQLRVRGVQVYGVKAEEGRAGECVALNIPDISHDEVNRGMVLAAKGYFGSSRFINAKFHMLPHLDRPLQPRTQIRMHIGTSDIPGHLVLPTLEPMRGGTESYVQIQLQQSMVAVPGDPFILRQLSPMKTLGGGYIIQQDNTRIRRREKDSWTEEVKSVENILQDDFAKVLSTLDKTGTKPLTVDELSKLSLLNLETTKANLNKIIAEGNALELDRNRLVHIEAVETVKKALISRLESMHKATPLSLGFPKKDVYKDFPYDHSVIDKALSILMSEKKIEANTLGLFIQSLKPALSPQQNAFASKLIAILKSAPFATPRKTELPALLGAPAAITEPIFRYLIQSGQIVELPDNIIFHVEALELAKQKIIEYITQKGPLESGVFKDILGTTRKYSIPIMEYWDSKGLTKRTGNTRQLK